MVRKAIFTIAASALALQLPTTALAGDGDVFGGIVAGILAAGINQAAQQSQGQRRQQQSRPSQSYGDPNVRRIQTELIYYGFISGGADGVMGQQTRSGIAAFQTFIQSEPTGSLTPQEQTLLDGAYAKAQAYGILSVANGGSIAGARGQLNAFVVGPKQDNPSTASQVAAQPQTSAPTFVYSGTTTVQQQQVTQVSATDQQTRAPPLCQRSCPPLYFSSISQVGGIGQ